ncbi:hypothetical protein EIP91_010958 [Steccherinum ochraceum]|uniref:Uncharacterized protein n=1 Tax=Steccherinum ochraceum TaxID=92696 RepID=A0A4R0R8H7_9APHY|nr:hypothetical protein EIP91_010958 [Steccherinum ochraceum]
MFSFFSRKPAAAPEDVPLPDSSPPPESRIIQDIDPSQAASSSHVQVQLRTPSPSIASGSAANGAHPSPAPTASTSSHRAASPTRPAEIAPVDAVVAPPTPESLSSLISSVPAKTLHAYTLSRIPGASEDAIKTLASFFDTLAPPPKLHCMRCHKDFMEVENDDRSCLVPHDDESAEVERVGRGTGLEARRTAGGTEYETLWGCCGKTTEGNGDQGPPDGFCYEGKHTTDIKRARFRADSTPQDDKLVSCLRLNCHGIRDTMPRSSARKRPRSRVVYKEATSDEDGSEGEADSGMEELAKKSSGGKGKPKSKAPTKGKGKAKEVDEDKMDVDEDDGEPDSASRAGSVRGKGKAKAKPPANPTTPSSAPKRRGRPPKSKVAAPKDSDAESVAASVKSAPATTKRRGRQPKSKMYVSDSEEERGRSVGPRGSASKPVSTAASPTRAPPQQPNLPLRTRSQSRTRVQSMVSRLEASTSSNNVTKTPSSRAKAAEADYDDEGQPKKRRKVVS